METRRKFRRLGQQIDELCSSMGILKGEIAARMGFTQSYISQMIGRGGTTQQIEQIAKALNISPYYFDRYHVLTLLDRVEGGEEFAQDIATLLIEGHKLKGKRQRDFLGKSAA